MGNASAGGLAYVTAGGGGGIAVTISSNTAGAGGIISSGTLSIAGGNNITISQNAANAITIIGGAGGAGFSAGVSGGNTSGSTGLTGTNLYLAGGNNITLSQSTGAAGASVTVSAANAGITALQVSNTTYTSGNVTFQNANGISFGSSGANGVSASYTQSGQAVSAQGGSSTFSTLVFTNSNNMSFSNTGGSIWGSHALNVSAAGGTSNALSGITFSNSGGVSFGLSTGAGVGTLTAGVATTAGYYFSGNTTGASSSSTALDQTVSIALSGGISGGWTNGSWILSSPVTSSLSATGAVSISINQSTISIGVPTLGTLSYWDNGLLQGSASVTQNGVGSVIVQQVNLEANYVISALRQFISNSVSSSSNSSYANSISIQGALYTLNASTLSLATSGSQSYAFTNTSNNSVSVLSGIKGLTLPLAATLTPGNYWLGMWSSTASANANWITFSNVVQYEGALTYNGLLGSSAAASNQAVFGNGIWSTTSANLPASIALSAITGTVGNISPFVNLYNVTA